MTDKHTFYVPRAGFSGDSVAFPDGEARHASRVLRLVPGNEVQVVDGQGGRFRVRVDTVGRHEVTGSVQERLEGEPAITPEVTLAVGLLKSAGRFETVLEKAAELGVARIVPMLTRRTEISRLRMDRSAGILVSAMKQSGRARLVALDRPTALADVLSAAPEELRLLCHETAGAPDGLAGVLRSAAGVRSVRLLVGPEGGFADDEVDAAVAAGFLPVSLGPTRLRTETAAIAAAAVVLLGT